MMRGTRFLPILMLVLLSSCSDDKTPARPSKPQQASPVLVEVARVQQRSVAKKWRRTGTLVYRRILRVYTQEAGRIIDLPLFEGDKVQQGDLLVTLDNARLKAELRKARASSSMARRRVARLERLRKTKATSEEDLIEAQTELELALAEVDILKTRLGYTTIEAPFDGIITHRLAEPGDVRPSNSHLLTVADPLSLVARVPAPEQLLVDLTPGSDILVQLDVPGAVPIKGSLLRIFPTLDPQSRQGNIEIQLRNPSHIARAGQFVRVTLTGVEKTRLMIPFSALRTDRKGEYVYTVRNGRVARQNITTGARFDNWLEVIEGLHAEDQIVKHGFMNLKSNTPVTISN